MIFSYDVHFLYLIEYALSIKEGVLNNHGSYQLSYKNARVLDALVNLQSKKLHLDQYTYVGPRHITRYSVKQKFQLNKNFNFMPFITE